jgi:hypothetical protein
MLHVTTLSLVTTHCYLHESLYRCTMNDIVSSNIGYLVEQYCVSLLNDNQKHVASFLSELVALRERKLALSDIHFLTKSKL